MKRTTGCCAALLALAMPVAPCAAAEGLQPLDPRAVQVGGEIGRRIDVTITNNLLQLDVDKDFLPPFRAQDGKTSYIGLGKLIDSAVRLAAYSNDPRALALKRRLVSETLKTQGEDGYIGLFPPDQRVKTLWDVHELGYVIWGLLSDYRLYGEKPSLAAARKAADFLLRHWSALPPDWGAGADVAPHVAFTGLERALLGLHQATADPAYLDFVVRTRKLPEWDLGIVIGRRAGIEGHVYAYLCRGLAQLELNALRPDPRLTRSADRALDFLTRRDGMLITGSAGQCEIWTGDQDARGDVGETCALAYQLRVCDTLLRARGEARLGDLMERTIFNALFASQSPDGRRLRYFAPVEGGRAYWNTDTYCCPCNFRRIMAELPAMLYYQTPDGVAVNLYAPSQARLTVGRGTPLAVRQETAYPSDGSVRLTLEPAAPATFALALRIPAWADGATVAVNGAPAAGAPAPGAFFTIRREWKAGDRIALDLPMRWRLVKGRQRQAGRVAVMRGPLVFCLNPAQNPGLAKLDGAELGYLALNPESLGEPVPDATVRPDGLACRVQAWKPGFGLGQRADYELTLTEFPDPDGKAAYFRLRDFSAAVDDELLSTGGQQERPTPRPAATDGAWVDLPGRPLSACAHFSEAPGARLSEVWSLANGVLVCRGAPRGYLTLADGLADFTLSLEWRRPAGVEPGKAGVLIRVTGPDKIWPRSLEAQLNAGAAGDFWGLDGFALDGPAERKSTVDHPQYGRLTNLKRTADAERPAGEWNRYEIEARGGEVTLRVNGVEVNRATGCDAAPGRVVLTAEGDAIEFRGVRLRAAGRAE